MFITLSYSTHLIISIFLHVLGVMIGLFVWYLFPKNVGFHEFSLAFLPLRQYRPTPVKTRRIQRYSRYSAVLGGTLRSK
ncbi:unnamed protein product [Heligmosomoides polygyrus]|uniref:Rhomboid domain-containing protein n=1 Tax=Heligmosomoides polygyrus TaxID=6339 RepID=A0A183GI30_HELPZ|nr:unnamed protein product [Heligmosomoides polygyrus]